MHSEPLVSCIMPTIRGSRDHWRDQARELFEAQTYPHKELVTDDGPGSVGFKRNRCCSRARGELICHWDDDDWSSPVRLDDQVERLLSSGAMITGYHTMLFLGDDGQWWRYASTNRHYALGTSLLYRKDYWRRQPFHDTNVGEDNIFIRGYPVLAVDAAGIMYARLHAANTSSRMVRLKRALVHVSEEEARRIFEPEPGVLVA